MTKCQKYAGSHAARGIVGQPQSTIDPLGWLRTGSIVIVNTAKGTVGEGTAALLGATLLNLIALGIAEQAELDPGQRRSATLMVDEFHTMPGADYEGILTELAKYGASLVLATQSLATLEALDRERERALRARVFANLDGLFAFHISAEDARYLVPELGEEIEVQDLVGLGEHQCYVKLSLAGERLPTFSVRLAPPPQGDPDLGNKLARASATRYGRERTAVERDLGAARARIELSFKRWPEASEPADKKDGKGAGTQTAGQMPEKGKQRSKKRTASTAEAEAIKQQPLFDTETTKGMGDEAGEPEVEDDELYPIDEGEHVD